VVLRRADDGDEFNEVKEFNVVGIDAPQRDNFAPPAPPADPPPPTDSAPSAPPTTEAEGGPPS
jgi:hypothetical protein